MKLTFKLLFAISFILILSVLASAQVMITKASREGGTVQIIKELGAILTEKDQVVSVMMVMPEDARPEDYKEIEVKKDDEIMMVNKKRIKSIKDFENLYNEVGINELIKMGVKRDGNLMIVEFEKIDPEKLPKGRQMMVKTAEAGEGGMITKTIGFSSDGKGMEGVQPLMGTGLVLGEEDKKVVVKMKMQGPEKDLGIEEGDEIISFNREKIKSLQQLVKLYEDTKVGDKIELGHKRDGKFFGVSFAKPEVKDNVMMKKIEKQ
jgi:PDZ domain-containing secreted protein